ncbi:MULTISPECIES: MBL fold metallo-hydrolase [Mycobacterium]|uniref:MBL fold metallo-hydrolase n=1 Tax=Mycobacterium kiyosense TaxID=2871094 RepID=A0A9P3Q6N0_9MYCO|nr:MULTISPECIES: MBL fold metallo-hydrolase [Mycobacterium]BDB40614.1 MBL fold metallo-hydrolase [Mycobacterium kiyosense]BDE12428.1 MBL fold metallo-hydrolase [Mycobacterium sp. 20KCMC460]GLB84064.1 MBL fold metallo-hydrolase [Mycobacterium kiyosense]GLB89838.1 MBL fold metallo-hydrolase [Mycobacterium kiyosense]GLB98245.1 MBL fold metallo-hydrolase [Mycobacterium kiyosense]
MDRVQLGRAAVTRVVELRFELPTRAFAHTPPPVWRDNDDLLVPDFVDLDTDQWHIAIQTWVVEVDGLTVVVDTGVGNGRVRPHMPPLDHLDTGFLAALQGAGIDRRAVDVVVNTHLHSDHVGWNTMLDKGSWVPTFPNARYLVPAADYRHFHPDGPAARQPPRSAEEELAQRGNRLVFEDSVLPVDEQIVQWSDDYQISPALRLRPAAGHTPGASVLWLDAGRPAVFVGDLTHSPVQLRRPDDACGFDVDAGAAAAARRRIFSEAAQSGAAVVPAHYPGHGGATLRPVDSGFDVERWLDFARL